MNKANPQAAKLRLKAATCVAGVKICKAGKEVLAAALLAVVVIFWTWQFVLHLSK